MTREMRLERESEKSECEGGGVDRRVIALCGKLPLVNSRYCHPDMLQNFGNISNFYHP